MLQGSEKDDVLNNQYRNFFRNESSYFIGSSEQNSEK